MPDTAGDSLVPGTGRQCLPGLAVRIHGYPGSSVAGAARAPSALAMLGFEDSCPASRLAPMERRLRCGPARWVSSLEFFGQISEVGIDISPPEAAGINLPSHPLCEALADDNRTQEFRVSLPFI